MEFQAVVMAGGKGSRMTDLTAGTPKGLLPIANLPMVYYPLHTLKSAGFEEVILVVTETYKQDFQKVLEMCDLKLKLDIVPIPDEEDWGTADSLRHIKDKIKTDVLVISCDLVTDLALHKLADIHRTYDSTVTCLMAPSPDPTGELPSPGTKKKKIERDFIGTDEKGYRLLFMASEADYEEKVSFRRSVLKRHPHMRIQTRLMDGHLYIMKKWVLDLLLSDRSISTLKGEFIPYLVRKQFSKPKPKDTDPENSMVHTEAESGGIKKDIYDYVKEDDLTSLVHEMSTWNDHRGDMDDCYHGNKIRCYTHIMNEGICIRANTLATFCEVNRMVPKHISTWGVDSRNIHPSATLESKSQVSPDSIVAEGVKVGERSGVKRSNIGKHCSIGEKVKITNSVIMNHVTISEGSTITGCVICEHGTIGARSELKDCLVGASHNIIDMSKHTNEVLVDMDRMMEF
ncbi:unnamed protein product [Owenia fusiformis]|uniref:Translation initiation factor eIF2B subunit gamma n=1 Tax=Owenia fusiformis TaxID=6347 RepID=A0A8J1UVC4_OWEFU|nr:unnamed protein product [Owenia fusiformis]